MEFRFTRRLVLMLVVGSAASMGCWRDLGWAAETLAELGARLGMETDTAYRTSPFSIFGSDYFSRYLRDPTAQPKDGEVMVRSPCTIVVPEAATVMTERMAAHLQTFLRDRMSIESQVRRGKSNPTKGMAEWTITLIEEGGGDPACPDSFTISVGDQSIRIIGRDAPGLRDGVAQLVDRMGLRLGPILRQGKTVYRPRLKVRLGAIPKLGTHKDIIFMGYNAVFAGGGNLHALSTSSVIPELKARQVPGAAAATAQAVAAAQTYRLRTYAFLNTREKFSKDDPVFKAHPDIRGALTWKADGEYVLCTEHPLVQSYLRDSIVGLFKAAPSLDGIVVIIGGEGFYHCFMRPYGVAKGHTNCARCEALGAEQVVANLCNLMAEAARSVQPAAEVIAWPYSAKHVWSQDADQAAYIRLLGPGTGLFTEIEKDTVIRKPHGVMKSIWDYSIDLIGPNARAQSQIAACRAQGIPIYLKSEPELGFEAPRLPHIPCMDRWAARAQALASCGADGAWVFPAFRPCYGTSACDINKLFWWDPHPDTERALHSLAARVAGPDAAPYLRQAWQHVSDAIDWSPELPSYYKGPYYLGPAHPMCANPAAELPAVFYGKYLFHAEITQADGLKDEPTFISSPTGNVPVFLTYYEKMAAALAEAVAKLETAEPLVPARHALAFEAESSPIRWFYHTARTEANFYAACQIRDQLLALRDKRHITDSERNAAAKRYQAWLSILKDEQKNAQDALPLVERDMRLDFYYGGDHTFSHARDMIQAKLALIQQEIETFLPSVKNAIGIVDP